MEDLNALLKKVKRLELDLNKKVTSYLLGNYASTFKGRGLEFEEVRPFQQGDDPRSIDWNVTARAGYPHIKRFKEERGLTIYLAVDLSASQNFHKKRSAITQIGSLIGASAVQNRDKIGLFLFTDHLELILPPKQNKQHLLRIIRELNSFVPRSKKSNLEDVLKKMAPFQKSSTVTFLISDFLVEDFSSPLKTAAKKSSLLAVLIEDPLEVTLPKGMLLELTDAETGEELLVDPLDPVTIEALKTFRKEHEKGITHLMDSCKIPSIVLKTDEDPLFALKRLLLKANR
jgi:uncharacterized protein (DUF58 family)